jgi:cytoskeletal protein CcmA (bactofilin family)
MLGSSKAKPGPVAAVTAETTSLIAHGTKVKGDVTFSGRLHIDGSIEGALHGEGDNAVLTLSNSAQIKGEIVAPHVVINGSVEGDVTSGARLELAAGARVEGNVFYKVMEMSAGAQINGKIVFRDGPPKQLSGPEAVALPEGAAAATA